MTNINQKIAISAASLTVLATVVKVPLVNAATFFDNGSDIFAAWLSDYDEPEDKLVQRAEQFTLTKDSEIRKITWSGQYFESGTPLVDDFTIHFFEIVQGTVASNPLVEFNLDAVERTDSGTDFFTLDVFNYSVTLAPFILERGEYLLSIVNNTVGEPDDWFWSSTLPENLDFERDFSHFYRKGGGAWKDDSLGNMAFSIEGQTISTPEPSMIFGTIIALGLGALSRKSKK